MASSKSRLGRGLAGLISGGIEPKKAGSPKHEPAPAKEKAPIAASKAVAVAKQPMQTPDGFFEIPMDRIEPNPHQPRGAVNPDSILELAESIRSEGLMQPIVVRRIEDRFQLIAGERRWRACQLLQMRTIPARVVTASEASSAVMALIENLQRENLNPIEESHGYASLMRDFDLTQDQVSDRVGKSRSGIANALRLLQLDREIQGYLSKGLLSVGHAKVLLGLEDAEQRLMLARRVIEKGFSVRDTERWVAALKTQRNVVGNRSVEKAESAVIQNIERKLASSLNTQVEIRHGARRGKIMIDYFGNEDLQRILDRLGVQML
jgi:ParB family chromosome partitioning protein